MKEKRKISFGFRGWMLVIYQAIAMVVFTAFTNFPMNLLADMYGGASIVTTVYTVGVLLGIVVQLILARFIGRVKNVKNLSMGFGIVSMVLALGIMLIPPVGKVFWLACFGLVSVFTTLWFAFSIGILVGQWFPRRKGTVMGVATFAFPLTNALLSVFAGNVFTQGSFIAFLPYFIVGVLGIVICAVFLKDYPEKCGAYRDNDKNMTMEQANAIMEAEIKAKETSVWKVGRTLSSRDFWFIVVPEGLLLLCTVGVLTQIVPIIMEYAPELAGLGITNPILLLPVVALFACFGSWLLGVLDTKFGTKTAILISVILMAAGGALGAVKNVYCLFGALFCVAIFEGASSNFTVSGAAQYWRREDFPSVFAVTNPIANIMQGAGPMIIAVVAAIKGFRVSFGIISALGIISIVLILLFSPQHVKVVDDKYRTKAGLPLDDALVGRK